MASDAGTILRTAAEIVSGERQRVHGPAREDFDKIAALWTAYLATRRGAGGTLSAENVAQMMELLKMARSQCGAFNEDDYVDAAGYAAIAGELAER